MPEALPEVRRESRLGHGPRVPVVHVRSDGPVLSLYLSPQDADTIIAGLRMFGRVNPRELARVQNLIADLTCSDWRDIPPLPSDKQAGVDSSRFKEC